MYKSSNVGEIVFSDLGASSLYVTTNPSVTTLNLSSIAPYVPTSLQSVKDSKLPVVMNVDYDPSVVSLSPRSYFCFASRILSPDDFGSGSIPFVIEYSWSSLVVSPLESFPILFSPDSSYTFVSGWANSAVASRYSVLPQHSFGKVMVRGDLDNYLSRQLFIGVVVRNMSASAVNLNHAQLSLAARVADSRISTFTREY